MVSEKKARRRRRRRHPGEAGPGRACEPHRCRVSVLPNPTSGTKFLNFGHRASPRGGVGARGRVERRVFFSSGTKKMPRGRPRKVHSVDPELDALLKLPHVSWDFTDNPLYDEDNNLVESRLEQWRRWCGPDGCKMLKIAEEEAPKTGKFHGQGRIIFRRKYRRAQLQKLWPDVHWEPTKAQKDMLYLMKPYTHFVLEYDDRHQGKRNVFLEQKEAVKSGSNIRECSELEGANYQSIRSAEILMTYFEP